MRGYKNSTLGMESADSNPPNSLVFVDSKPPKLEVGSTDLKFVSNPWRVWFPKDGICLLEMLVENSGMFPLLSWVNDSVVTWSKVVLKTDPWSVNVLKNSVVLNTGGSALIELWLDNDGKDGCSVNKQF